MELSDLIKALESMLPEKVPYGDMIGAEGAYAHSGPLVYEDPEPYFIEQAAAELKRLSEIQDILGPVYDADHLRELIQADREGHRPELPIGRCKDCDCYWPNAEQCGHSEETVKENDFCSKFKPKEAPND